MNIEICFDGDTGECQAMIRLKTFSENVAAKKIAKLKKLLAKVKL